MASMETSIDNVRDWLDRKEWNYQFNAERNVIETGLKIHNKLQSTKMFIHFNENGEDFTVYAYCAMKAADESRAAVAEYIGRANYGLRSGCFEMDYRDGEVRYKVYTNHRGYDHVNDALIEAAIFIPANMMERYGDGLAAICLGFSDPITEIEKAEAPRE